MLRLGLTGGIACGKSATAEIFVSLGCPVIDADKIVAGLLSPESATVYNLTKRFGTVLLNGQGCIDKGRLRSLIFSNECARQFVNKLIHPLVRREIIAQIAASAPALVCVIVVPLLFEAGMEDLVDKIIVVDASEEVQLKRVMVRDGIAVDQAEKILHSQLTRQQRLTKANYVIENTEDGQEKLRLAVTQLHRDLMKVGEQTVSQPHSFQG